MKKMLFSVCLGFGTLAGFSQGFIEKFEYPAGSNIGGNNTTTPSESNNWATINGSVSNDVPIEVVDGSLSYIEHFASAGNKILLPTTNGSETRDVARMTGLLSSGTETYYSFLINVIDDSRLQETMSNNANFIALSNGAFNAGTVPNGGGPSARVSIIKYDGGFRLGIVNNQTADYTVLPKTLDFGFTHLVVVKYTELGDAGNQLNDLAELWVNPSASGIEANGDPIGGVSNNLGAGTPNNFPQLQIRTGANGPNAYLDEIRVGTTLADVVPSVLLPVNLIKFEGVRNKAGVMLHWNTAQESNNEGFDIERSVDGSFFSSVGHVASKAVNGSSANIISYQFADATAPQQKLYYRLKQFDTDGRTSMSKTIIIDTGNGDEFVAEFSRGNTVTGILGIRLLAPESGVVNFRVLDNQGRVLLHKTSQFSTGSNYNTQDVSRLANGTYFIQVSTGKWQKTLRFRKQ